MSNRLTKEKVLVDLPDGDDHESTTESDSDNDSDSGDSTSDSDYECTICNKKFSGAIPLRQHEKGSKHKKVLARKKKERKFLNKDNNSEEDEEGSENFIPEPFQVCKVCDKQFSGPEPYHLHLKSKTHKQKVSEASILEMVREKGEINVEKLKKLYKIKKRETAGEDLPDSNKETLASVDLEDEEDDESNKVEYECKDCEKTFCGLKPFTQHLVSKTHAKQVEKKILLRKILSKAKGEPSDGSLISDVSTLSLEDDTLVCKACSTAFSGPGNALSHLKSQKHAKKLEKYIKKLQKKKKDVVKPTEPDTESPVNEDTSKPENKEKEETPEERDEPDIKSETVKTEDSISSSDEETEDSNSSSDEETEDTPMSGEKQNLTKDKN